MQDITNLNETVIETLNFFSQTNIEKQNFDYSKPLIVGSWNAIEAAKIIHHKEDAIFADENDYQTKSQTPWIDKAIIYSASWQKHAPIIARYLKQKSIETKLVTCTKDSDAEKVLGRKNTVITPKITEPYTYNTSTYMWWILSNTNEDASRILLFIENDLTKQLAKINLKDYKGFLFAIPNRFSFLSKMIDTKFVELFGRNIARDVRTYEELKHAITLVPSDNEIWLAFWGGDFYFKQKKVNINIPDNIWVAWFMAIAYFTVGKIQEQHYPYFKENIKEYIDYLNNSWFTNNLNIMV